MPPAAAAYQGKSFKGASGLSSEAAGGTVEGRYGKHIVSSHLSSVTQLLPGLSSCLKHCQRPVT